MITRLLGDLPRLELFAREQTEGWGALGNDINHFPKIEHQQNLSEMKHERAHKKMRKA
jgi:N6-adenosine-specific RNA methylase IME4